MRNLFNTPGGVGRPGRIPRHPVEIFWFLWGFGGGNKLLTPTPSCGRPPPNGQSSDSKSECLCSLLFPELSKLHVSGDLQEGGGDFYMRA